MHTKVKTKNEKLKVKALVDSKYTHIGINEQLVKNKRIQTKPINFLFEGWLSIIQKSIAKTE